jgi:diacylglycerol kinase (ATP)
MNKPRYSFIKNLGYALEGLLHVFRHEMIFRIEAALFVVLSIVAWSVDAAKCEHLWLQVSLFFPIIAELINSAVERGIDLSTREYHHLAKAAKDSAAAACLLSVAVTALVWAVVLL